MGHGDGTHGSLCRACGFCCDGTLFSRGSLNAEEVDSARRQGLKLLADARSFAQPCAGHAGSECTIYAHRPTCCRKYRCTLLDEVDAGNTTYESALERVARVRELERVVRQAAPDERAGDPLFVVARNLAEDAIHEPFRREHAQLMLDLGELVMLCRRHFGARDDATL